MDDPVQFQELALKYLDSLYNYARLLTRDDTETEDLLQEALLRAFRHRTTIDSALNPKAWLFKVMRNVHIDRCRARSAQPSEVALSNGDAPEHEVQGSRFLFTSALSDDPLISFRVRAGQGGVLRAALGNTRGQRFEALARVEVS